MDNVSEYLQIMYVQVSNIHARVIVKWPLVYLCLQKLRASRYPIKHTEKCHEALFCLIVVIANLGCLGAWLWPSQISKANIAVTTRANFDAEVRHLEVDDELSLFRQARGTSVAILKWRGGGGAGMLSPGQLSIFLGGGSTRMG